jgi:Tfp pilus assembly protein PilE
VAGRVSLVQAADRARRAQRAGQQFLLDIAQRQEQFLLDQRQYAAVLGTGGLGSSVPSELATRYQAPVVQRSGGCHAA